jgi:hypothetical protein
VIYDIEDIAIDHPALLTGNFEACAIARCRQCGPSPWSLLIHCRDLPKCGTRQETRDVAWQNASEAGADKAEKAYQGIRLTEDAAIGVCAAAFAALGEGRITEVTLHGTGVDYWVDDRRAVLEVSGIEKGSSSDLTTRHQVKTNQLKQGSLFNAGYPGYVFVTVFSQRQAVFSFHA